jgi:hypothetical protein
MRNKDPNPFDLLEQELEEELQLELDIWYAEEVDRVLDYWDNCPPHLVEEALTLEESWANIESYEDKVADHGRTDNEPDPGRV